MIPVQQLLACSVIGQVGGLMAGYGLVVLDMIKGNVNSQRHGLLYQEATKITPNTLHLTRIFRR